MKQMLVIACLQLSLTGCFSTCEGTWKSQSYRAMMENDGHAAIAFHATKQECFARSGRSEEDASEAAMDACRRSNEESYECILWAVDFSPTSYGAKMLEIAGQDRANWSGAFISTMGQAAGLAQSYHDREEQVQARQQSQRSAFELQRARQMEMQRTDAIGDLQKRERAGDATKAGLNECSPMHCNANECGFQCNYPNCSLHCEPKSTGTCAISDYDFKKTCGY